MEINNLFEVFAFRHIENINNNGSVRRGFFKLRLYLGINDWLTIDGFKLVEKNNYYYIVPPAEMKNNKFIDFIEMSGDRNNNNNNNNNNNGLKWAITKKAIDLYKTYCTNGIIGITNVSNHS